MERYFQISLFDPINLVFITFGPEKLFAVFAGLLFTYINFRGAKETGLAGNIVTLLKVTVILIFVLFGFGVIFGQPASVTEARFRPFLPRDFGGVFIAMGLTFIAFEGYEIIVQSGEEVVDPRQSVPKAVFYAMAIVVTIYMLVSIVLIGAIDITPGLFEFAREGAVGGHGATNLPELPASRDDTAVWQILGYLGELGLARAADQVLPYGTLVILVAGIFSTLSALNATTYSSTRVSFAMGRDRVLPDAFSRIHHEKRTPWLATVLSGGLIIFMAVALPIEAVAAATDVMFLLLFLQVNYAAIVIRRRWGDQIEYGYVMPWFPYVPIIGIITKLGLAVYLFNYSPLAWYGAIAWILAGIAIFFLYSRRRVRDLEAREETRFLAERRTPVDRRYKILVPIANPENAKQLVRVASRIARRREGELHLTAVETVPDQTPLEEGHRYIEDEEEELERAMEFVPEDVPAHWSVTIGHDVGRSINNIAHQRESDLIVMGWRGRRKRTSDYVLGSIIDHVVEHAPCDVSVVKTGTTTRKSRKVLVPIAGGYNSDFAVDVGAAYEETGAEVTLLTVAPDGGSAEALLTSHEERLPESNIEVTTEVIGGEDIAEAIVDYAEANDFDTVVLGAAAEGYLRRIVFGEIPERVGEEFSGGVIMVKRYRGARSDVRRFIRRWIGKGGKARLGRATGSGD